MPARKPLGPQDLMMKYSFFKNQLEQSVEELKNLELIKGDHLAAKNTLESMKALRTDNESLLPIGGNTFLITKVSDKDKVLVEVGSKVVMGRSVESALSRIESLLDELGKREKELVGNIQHSQSELEQIVPVLQSMERQASQKQ